MFGFERKKKKSVTGYDFTDDDRTLAKATKVHKQKLLDLDYATRELEYKRKLQDLSERNADVGTSSIERTVRDFQMLKDLASEIAEKNVEPSGIDDNMMLQTLMAVMGKGNNIQPKPSIDIQNAVTPPETPSFSDIENKMIDKAVVELVNKIPKKLKVGIKTGLVTEAHYFETVERLWEKLKS